MLVMGIITTLGGGAGITKSTIEREPLDKQYTNMCSTWFVDDIGWVRSPAAVEKGLRYFYDKTGVQPLFYLTETVNGSYTPAGPEVQAFAESLYNQYFTDEAHMVFVFQCKDEDTRYNMAACTGAQAKTVVDDEALEILYDYFDSNFYSDMSEDEFIAASFQRAADRMMKTTPNYTFVGFVIACALVGFFLLIVFIRMLFKRAHEKAEETVAILNADTKPLDRDSSAVSDLRDKYGSDS